MVHRSLVAGLVVAVSCMALNLAPAVAQSPKTAVPSAPPQRQAAGVAKAVPTKGRECTRLPLSDIQVGREKTIEVARLRLDEYMAKVGAKRGWKSWDKSQETVTCDEYLFVPLLGQEYKCMVTATFCRKN